MRDREHDIMMTETRLDRLTVDLQDILTWVVEHKEQRSLVPQRLYQSDEFSLHFPYAHPFASSKQEMLFFISALIDVGAEMNHVRLDSPL